MPITPQDLGILPEEYEVKLVTEDGVKLYENTFPEGYVEVLDNGNMYSLYGCTIEYYKCNAGDRKCFSNKETAKKYAYEQGVKKLKSKYNQ
jgi:hypothetical protein